MKKNSHSRYGTLLKDLKSSSTGNCITNCHFLKKFNLCLFDSVLFLSRRILIVFVVLLVTGNGLLQLSIVLACWNFNCNDEVACQTLSGCHQKYSGCNEWVCENLKSLKFFENSIQKAANLQQLDPIESLEKYESISYFGSFDETTSVFQFKLSHFVNLSERYLKNQKWIQLQ